LKEGAKYSVRPVQKKNPHCPVAGCKTAKPHADDPIVRGMIAAFAPPEQMTFWVLAAMSELGQSITRDFLEKKYFAWHARLRQPEEMYVRALYAIFIANEKELHHIFSGDMPNGFSAYYRHVNELVFEGRGLLLTNQLGLTYGTFKPMETLHDGAHVSFRAFMTCIGFKNNPENLPSPEAYSKHLVTYCKYLDYMHGMFKAGKEKKHVLEGIKNLHRPASHWQAKGGRP
jgi:hypothetical protein